jgi:hypothetical protein
MVGLVLDRVPQPGQPRSRLPVEAPDVLQHVQLADLAEARVALRL